jgi:hypothetical protein
MRIRILLFLAFTISFLSLKAQDYKVLGVEPLPFDMTARDYIKLDEKGRQCAMFRIVTKNIAPEMREGFHFDCDWNSYVVAHTLNEGEIWVWVSPGIKTLKIKHELLGPWDLHLTQYIPKVEPLFTYRITLQGTANEIGVVHEEVAQQYLSFQISPTNAMLEVDGEIWAVTWDGKARKRVKEGSYAYLVQAPNYESIADTVIVADSAVSVIVRLNPILVETEKPKERRKTFITLNGAYSTPPCLSYGFSVGQVRRFGWFVSLMSNLGFTGYTASGTCDTGGFLENGALPIYSGTVRTDRHSVIVGGVIRLAGPLCVRVGVGYGAMLFSWETTDGVYYNNKGYSLQGIDVSGGLQLNLGHFVVSTEAVSTNFKTIEGKLGLGMSF